MLKQLKTVTNFENCEKSDLPARWRPITQSLKSDSSPNVPRTMRTCNSRSGIKRAGCPIRFNARATVHTWLELVSS